MHKDSTYISPKVTRSRSNTEERRQNSLSAGASVILTWKEISVFEKEPRKPPRIHFEKGLIQHSKTELLSSPALIDSPDIAEILVGNGWNDKEEIAQKDILKDEGPISDLMTDSKKDPGDAETSTSAKKAPADAEMSMHSVSSTTTTNSASNLTSLKNLWKIILIEKNTLTEKAPGPSVPIGEPSVPTGEPSVPSVPTEEPSVPSVPTGEPSVPTGEPSVPTREPGVPTGEPSVPAREPGVPTREPSVQTRKYGVRTGQPSVPTGEPGVPTREQSVPTGEPGVPTGEPSVPTREPGVPTGEPSVSTREPGVPTGEPSVSTREPGVPTGKVKNVSQVRRVPELGVPAGKVKKVCQIRRVPEPGVSEGKLPQRDILQGLVLEPDVPAGQMKDKPTSIPEQREQSEVARKQSTRSKKESTHFQVKIGVPEQREQSSVASKQSTGSKKVSTSFQVKTDVPEQREQSTVASKQSTGSKKVSTSFQVKTGVPEQREQSTVARKQSPRSKKVSTSFQVKTETRKDPGFPRQKQTSTAVKKLKNENDNAARKTQNSKDSNQNYPEKTEAATVDPDHVTVDISPQSLDARLLTGSRKNVPTRPVNGVKEERVKKRNKLAEVPEVSEVPETQSMQQVNLDGKQSRLSRILTFRRNLKTLNWRPILQGVTGIAYPSSLLAIVGMNGSGKTTLLNVLAGRTAKGLRVSGTLRVNGIRVKTENRDLSAYLARTSQFIGSLTVKETLAFRSMLKLKEKTTKQARNERLLDILKDMELMDCADMLVCQCAKKGITLGEARRLALGCEMINNPPVVFCDDPMSGLDTLAADTMSRVLRKLADRSHTVVCTLRHPSSQTFASFDKMLLLSWGREAFMGTSSEAVLFFNSIGLTCPKYFNPLDFFIQNLAFTGPEQYVRFKSERVHELYFPTKASSSIRREIDNVSSAVTPKTKEGLQLTRSTMLHKAPWLVQVRVNVWRSMVVILRQKKATILAGFRWMVLLGLVIGAIFFGVGRGDQEADGLSLNRVMNVNGALFSICTSSCLFHCYTVMVVLAPWSSLLLYDLKSHLYKLWTFYLALHLTELPFLLTLSPVLVAISYWMVGLRNDAWAFLLALLVVTIASNVSASFGHMLWALSCSWQGKGTGWGGVSTDGGGKGGWFRIGHRGGENAPGVVAAPVLVTLVLVAGFLVNAGSVPDELSWLRYFSWFWHSHRLLMVNQWLDAQSASSSHTTAQITGEDRNWFSNGTQVLQQFNVKSEDTFGSYLTLAALHVVFRLVAFLALCRWSKKATASEKPPGT